MVLRFFSFFSPDVNIFVPLKLWVQWSGRTGNTHHFFVFVLGGRHRHSKGEGDAEGEMWGRYGDVAPCTAELT